MHTSTQAHNDALPNQTSNSERKNSMNWIPWKSLIHTQYFLYTFLSSTQIAYLYVYERFLSSCFILLLHTTWIQCDTRTQSSRRKKNTDLIRFVYYWRRYVGIWFWFSVYIGGWCSLYCSSSNSSFHTLSAFRFQFCVSVCVYFSISISKNTNWLLFDSILYGLHEILTVNTWWFVKYEKEKNR